MISQKFINDIAYRIVGAAIEVHDLGGTLKLDLLVNNLIIVELKAVDVMIPLFRAQLQSYLKLTGKPKGLLINFHCENIIQQMVPLVTDVFSKLPKT